METNVSNNYCVILAGGKGRRLWPCSREQRPKQFVDFFGSGQTQLRQTFDRFARIIPVENIYVNTNDDYVDLVKEQLPELKSDNVMAEPIHRNTAPGTVWTTHRIFNLNPKANIVISPSDHMVLNEDVFADDIEKGLCFVSKNDCVLALGVKPTRPEPGYGYIQMGERVEDNIYKVQSFTEKPERDFAKIFMDSGEFCWNTGLFFANARYCKDRLASMLPVVLRNFDAQHPVYNMEEENEFIRKNFPSYPNMSLEYGFLEKADNVCVMKCNFGWADLGTWHGIYEAMHRGDGDNVIIDSDVMMDNARNNVIKLSEGKFAVINGLDGFIVAEQDNVLLICKKEDSSALLRKFVNEVQMKKGDEYI